MSGVWGRSPQIKNEPRRFPTRGSRARTASAGGPAARFLRGGVECRRGARRQRRVDWTMRQIAEIARAAIRAGAANAGGEKRAFRIAARDPRWVPNPARPSRCRRVLLDRVPPAHADLREPLPGLSSRSGSTRRRMTLPSRAVPVLGGRARLERATRGGGSLRQVPAKPIGAGKPTRRFLAASSGSVIRVDPTRPPAHRCAWHRSPKRIPYSPRRRAQRGSKPRRFPARGSRARTASAGVPAARFLRGGVECRRGPRTAAESRFSAAVLSA